jgi:hypothetical protein
MKNYRKELYFFVFVLLLSFNHLQAQSSEKDKRTISGYVKDSKNGEKLIGVNVYIKGTTIGTTTNEYGFYSITLAKGTYDLVASYIGYMPLVKPIDLSEGNAKMDFEIVEQDIQLQEVVVKAEAEDQNVKSIEMSTTKLDIKTIQKIPAFLGEVDIIRSIQLL